MSPLELTLAVVGIDYPNADKSNRTAELLKCSPGDRIELRLEPTNEHDANAIAVFSARGVQVGYVTAERAPYIRRILSGGEPYEAIFQRLDVTAAYVRARFGGGAPTMPINQGGENIVSPPPRAPRPSRSRAPYDPHEFQPDPDGPEWGA